MKRTIRYWALLPVLWVCLNPLVTGCAKATETTLPADAAVITPAPGTPLRKAILDALRQNVQSWSKLEVVFVVDDLKVKSDWAWVHTRPQSKDGQSRYEDILALMQRRDGVWMVAELVCTEEDNPECIGSPDYFSKLKERFPGVPEDILPAPEEMEENVENMQ